MSMAERIRQKINERGMTAVALANAAHINRSYLTRLLNGQAGDRIEFGTADRVSRALGVDIYWLVSGESERERETHASNRDVAEAFALRCGISREAIEVAKKDRMTRVDAPPLTWLFLMYTRELSKK